MYLSSFSAPIGKTKELIVDVIKDIPNAPKPVGPYSPVVKSGGLVFCAGQIGLDPASGKLREGLEAQTEQVLKNLNAVLSAAGSSPKSIVMTTIFLTEMSQFKVVNELYANFVSADRAPARQTVAVSDLPLGALVEISVIAEAC